MVGTIEKTFVIVSIETSLGHVHRLHFGKSHPPFASCPLPILFHRDFGEALDADCYLKLSAPGRSYLGFFSVVVELVTFFCRLR